MVYALAGCRTSGDVVEFRLLGPLEVRVGDRPIRLGGSRQQALLAVLLLEANRVVSVDRLVDAIWGQAPLLTVVPDDDVGVAVCH